MSEDDIAKQDDAERLQAMNGQPEADAAPIAERRRSRSRLRNVAVGVVFGSVIGLIGTIGVFVLINRGQLPIGKPSDFEAAINRWHQHGPRSYAMDLDWNFDTKGMLRVEVRNGEVTAMSLDGKESPARLWDSYSVDGLLAVIQRDFDLNERATNNPGGPLPRAVLQQAEFDLELGFPRRYQRTDLLTGQTGEWRVVKFGRVD